MYVYLYKIYIVTYFIEYFILFFLRIYDKFMYMYLTINNVLGTFSLFSLYIHTLFLFFNILVALYKVKFIMITKGNIDVCSTLNSVTLISYLFTAISYMFIWYINAIYIYKFTYLYDIYRSINMQNICRYHTSTFKFFIFTIDTDIGTKVN